MERLGGNDGIKLPFFDNFVDEIFVGASEGANDGKSEGTTDGISEGNDEGAGPDCVELPISEAFPDAFFCNRLLDFDDSPRFVFPCEFRCWPQTSSSFRKLEFDNGEGLISSSYGSAAKCIRCATTASSLNIIPNNPQSRKICIFESIRIMDNNWLGTVK